MMADVRDRISVTHETHDVRESFLPTFVRYCTYIKRKKDAVAKEKKCLISTTTFVVVHKKDAMTAIGSSVRARSIVLCGSSA